MLCSICPRTGCLLLRRLLLAGIIASSSSAALTDLPVSSSSIVRMLSRTATLRSRGSWIRFTRFAHLSARNHMSECSSCRPRVSASTLPIFTCLITVHASSGHDTGVVLGDLVQRAACGWKSLQGTVRTGFTWSPNSSCRFPIHLDSHLNGDSEIKNKTTIATGGPSDKMSMATCKLNDRLNYITTV